MLIASAQVETTLLALKLAFLVLLYLFIWRIVRSAARDLRLPQESMILAPQQAAAAGLIPQPAARELGRLVVVASPTFQDGEIFVLDAHPLTVGRAVNNDVSMPDENARPLPMTTTARRSPSSRSSRPSSRISRHMAMVKQFNRSGRLRRSHPTAPFRSNSMVSYAVITER